MARSPKKEQGNGKKFQNRLPGEKRNRKVDAEKLEPKKTKFYTDSKPSAPSADKPRFENKSRKINDRPRFSTGLNKGFDKSERPRFGGENRGGDRTDRPRFGGKNKGFDRPKFGNVSRGNENPRFNSDNRTGGDRPKFGGSPRSSFKKPGEGFTGGDRNGNPRFAGDKSDHPKFGGSKNGPTHRGNDRPRFSKEGGFDKPRPSTSFKGGSDRGSDRVKFVGDRGTGRSKFEREDRQFDKPRKERTDTFESAEKFNKPKLNPGAGLSKFKPIGSEPIVPKRNFIETEQKRTHYSEEEKPKTFGIPKADKADTPVAFKGSKREFNRVVNNLEKSANHAQSNEIRLNRYIANSGICSRREADDLIMQGLVKVNGVVVKELGTKIRPTDNVKVEDRKVIPEKPVYIIMNKPKGYITTTDDPEGRKTVMELIDLPGKARIYPIGRLDRNTTGVLLLTNDGEMSQKLMHPSFEIKKVYRATLDKKPSKEHMLQLVEGVELEDGMMAFEQCGFVEEGKENVLGIEIKSGRNRIVRRMFEHFGYEVTALDRVLLGEFDKVKLGRGKWRFLTEKEMNYVERLKRTKPKSIKQ
jgi:23S rRNA pseudouridine2605 synthase